MFVLALQSHTYRGKWGTEWPRGRIGRGESGVSVAGDDRQCSEGGL